MAALPPAPVAQGQMERPPKLAPAQAVDLDAVFPDRAPSGHHVAYSVCGVLFGKESEARAVWDAVTALHAARHPEQCCPAPSLTPVWRPIRRELVHGDGHGTLHACDGRRWAVADVALWKTAVANSQHQPVVLLESLFGGARLYGKLSMSQCIPSCWLRCAWSTLLCVTAFPTCMIGPMCFDDFVDGVVCTDGDWWCCPGCGSPPFCALSSAGKRRVVAEGVEREWRRIRQDM